MTLLRIPEGREIRDAIEYWREEPAGLDKIEGAQAPFRWASWRALSIEDARAAAAEFPPPESSDWHTFRNGPLEDGKQEGSASIAGPFVAAILADFDDALTEALASGFREPFLMPDPHRTGAGIHQSGPGARLGMHIDFNVHPQDDQLIRAVNVILFLTATFGNGQLILGGGELPGHPGAQRQQLAFRPFPGLLVAFECCDTGWHGHPEPMGIHAPLRKSIPGYWFRPRLDGEQIEAHSTIFRDA